MGFSAGAVATAQREVVQPQADDQADLGIGQSPDPAQQRAAADQQVQDLGQACPGPVGQRERDLAQHRGQ